MNYWAVPIFEIEKTRQKFIVVNRIGREQKIGIYSQKTTHTLQAKIWKDLCKKNMLITKQINRYALYFKYGKYQSMAWS